MWGMSQLSARYLVAAVRLIWLDGGLLLGVWCRHSLYIEHWLEGGQLSRYSDFAIDLQNRPIYIIHDICCTPLKRSSIVYIT
jgi:hypothetical protein